MTESQSDMFDKEWWKGVGRGGGCWRCKREGGLERWQGKREKVRSLLLLLSSFLLFTPVEGEGRRLGERESLLTVQKKSSKEMMGVGGRRREGTVRFRVLNDVSNEKSRRARNLQATSNRSSSSLSHPQPNQSQTMSGRQGTALSIYIYILLGRELER